MNQLGQDPSEAELIEMINSVDDNGDNEIDFAEFLVLMKSRIGERDPEKELRDAFAVFDSDGSGFIDRSELKKLMANLGQALTDGELDDMMDEVDTNGDGEISFEEFKAMMVRSGFTLPLWVCSQDSILTDISPIYNRMTLRGRSPTLNQHINNYQSQPLFSLFLAIHTIRETGGWKGSMCDLCA